MTIPANDYDKDAGLSGAQYRAEDNTIVESVLTNNAAVGFPPQTFPFMWRVDQSRTPNVLQIRNPANSAFIDVAEVTDTLVSLFSDGGGVPSLGVEQTFTEAQSVDVLGTAGSFTVGSDQSSGIIGRYRMIGHNDIGGNVVGVNLVCRIGTNTAGAEDFSFEVEVVRGGSSVIVATLGSLSDFRRSGGGGILDADTIRQAGVTLEQIAREAAGRFATGGNFTAGFEPVQADEGKMFRFNGTSDIFIDLAPLARDTVMYFMNESNATATITFRAAPTGGINEIRTPKLTLPAVTGQAPTCAVHWYLTTGDRVNIVGDNV